ncbi:AfsR/SARP family transcriptional regulator [Planctomonas psychrotolerans]|uniref:AfsR/SARP family transcriptional regulator n=1 Tax=Planctomonas psychrotolerans TaxID=2528712 RepID=UPI001238DA1B|nr:BTAD domain-containing putative transcriptional regulator [Planctomonas psychrotolerans]
MTHAPARTENNHSQPDGDRLAVTVIGPLTVRRGAVVLDAHSLGGPKPRQIFEILLLNIGLPVSKARLIDLLWGDAPPREALTSLESYVSVLRRHLQPGHGRSGPLRTATGGYLIDRAAVDLDLVRFETLVHEAQGLEPAGAFRLLSSALALVTGPLLGDELRSAWAEEERRRHAVTVAAVRVVAAEAAMALGRFDEAIRWSEEVLAGDPLNERAWLSLLSSLERNGHHAEGLRAFAECRAILNRELGCAPNPALRQVHARLLTITAADQSDLSEAVAALLILNDRLARTSGGTPADSDAPQSLEAIRHAGLVLSSFLQRVSEAA